jgi:protein-S-isoprenylcysteine O-methyltransferase Ste14
MSLLGPPALGLFIFILLALLVFVKWVSTGAVLDRPQGTFLVQLVNVFNLFFLLIVNPLTAVLLLLGRLPSVDLTHLRITVPLVVTVLEIVGLVLYMAGFFLMAWALLTLARNYQLGGMAPRPEDSIITGGPYRLIRHPMYAAALCISAGLTLLVQSWVLLGVFLLYLVLILRLIPLEEERLLRAYGEQYEAYRRRTRALVFFLPAPAGHN